MRALKHTDDEADSWLQWPRTGKRDRPDGSTKLHGTRHSTRSRLRPSAWRPRQAPGAIDLRRSDDKIPREERDRDIEERVEVLGRPEVLSDLRRRDPLAAARLRGLSAKKDCSKQKGTRSREGAAQLSASRAKPWTSAASPASGWPRPWQTRLCLPGLANWSEWVDAVLAELDEYDPWTQTLFMLSANSWLNGETPLAALRSGELDEVLNAPDCMASRGPRNPKQVTQDQALNPSHPTISQGKPCRFAHSITLRGFAVTSARRAMHFNASGGRLALPTSHVWNLVFGKRSTWRFLEAFVRNWDRPPLAMS